MGRRWENKGMIRICSWNSDRYSNSQPVVMKDLVLEPWPQNDISNKVRLLSIFTEPRSTSICMARTSFNFLPGTDVFSAGK